TRHRSAPVFLNAPSLDFSPGQIHEDVFKVSALLFELDEAEPLLYESGQNVGAGIISSVNIYCEVRPCKPGILDVRHLKQFAIHLLLPVEWPDQDGSVRDIAGQQLIY